MMRKKRTDQGTILIFALWTLALLVVFAVYIGIGIRQRMIFAERLESRNKLYYAAVSGVRKAMAVLDQVRSVPGSTFFTATKKALLNNEEDFSSIELNDASVEVTYDFFDKSLEQNKKQYGMIDEASKININSTSLRALIRLFQIVLGWDVEPAERLALAIVNWRTSGESELKGFFSDEYYENLEHPYAPKNASFETLDELLLVEGMNGEIFERLRNFITVYGDGRVNINTASFEALRAMGFDQALSAKIIERRAGADEVEGTDDDYIFDSEGGLVLLLRLSSVAAERDVLFAQQLENDQQFRVDSDIYSIESFARLERKNQEMKIRCVYDAAAKSILYWREIQ